MGNNRSRIHIYNKDNKCPICLEDIGNITVLSCGHCFDIECIQMAFMNNYL